MDDVGEGDLLGFLAELEEEGASPPTLRRKVASVTTFYRFLMRNGISNRNPVTEIELQPPPRRSLGLLSDAEVSRLLEQSLGDGARALRDRAILELVFGAALRTSELLAIEIRELTLKTRLCRVRSRATRERMSPSPRWDLLYAGRAEFHAKTPSARADGLLSSMRSPRAPRASTALITSSDCRTSLGAS